MSAPLVSYGVKTPYPRTAGLDELLRIQIQKTPDKTALVYASRTLSYRELDQKVNAWSQALSRENIAFEEPIGLLLDPGIEQIIVQLAIIRVGATCVPLDSAQPDARLSTMLNDLGTRLLITSARQAGRLPIERVLTIEMRLPNAEPLPLAADALHRTHILYTSGSTGKPKAVQMEARGIARLVLNREFFPIEETDRVAHISNPTFDPSLLEIWGALLNGATLVILPKQSIIDPFSFKESLRSQKISAIFVTTSLFNLIAQACPDAFKGVRQIIIGGEAANAQAMRDVLIYSSPDRLINGYGPTENTTFSTSLCVSLEDLNDGSVSIGYPIDNSSVYILNDQLKPVGENEIGELCTGGDGLARGYWNREDLTAERFIMAQPIDDEPPVRLYRTGDMARWRPDGSIDFMGRADKQIKLHGYRIELEEIESTLLASGDLQGAVVDLIKPESDFAEPYLLAYIAPKKADTFDRKRLIEHVQKHLPTYMHPRLEVVDHIPLNANGKADRQRLHASRREKASARKKSNPILSAEPIQNRLKIIWQEILDQPDISGTDHFFEMGGSSLKAAGLMIAINRHFKQSPPVQALYENPTLETFSRHFQNWLDRGTSLQIIDEVAPLRADSHMADHLMPLPGPVPDWLDEQEGHIFITGATGFLGAFFLRDLLALPGIKEVACLIRCKTEAEGLERIRKNMDEYHMWQSAFAQRLRILPGNLADEWLGLGEDALKELARWSSTVFHLGAHVDYTQPYATHRPANIMGTYNMLRFANSERPKAFHYISSIASYGPTGFFTGITELKEDEPLEPHLYTLKYDTGYSQSQWVAEQLVWSAHNNGLPVSIYRPGFIMGDSHHGHGNTRDFVARLIKGCISIDAYPILPKQSKKFVSVDYVSNTLLTIARDNRHVGKAYNLVPLDNDDSVDLMGLFDLLSDCGYPLRALPYREWVEALGQDDNLADNPLLPLLPMLSEPVYGELTRWEVYENMPHYRTDNVRQVLGKDARSFTLNRDLLSQYLQSWEARGFLHTSREVA